MLLLAMSLTPAQLGQDSQRSTPGDRSLSFVHTLIVKERTAPDRGSPGLAPGGGVVEPLRRSSSASL